METVDKKITNASRPNYLSTLDIFATSPTDVTVLESEYIKVRQSNPKGTEIISFIVGNTVAPNIYLDFSNSFLAWKVKVLTETGGVLPATADVAISNMMFYTMFQNCTVDIVGKPMSQSSLMYPYRGIFKTFVSFRQLHTIQMINRLVLNLYYHDLKGC